MQVLDEPIQARPAPPAAWSRARFTAFYQLTKPGIVRHVVLTAATGFFLASRGGVDLGLLLHTLIGVGFAAAGTNALNQYVERELDARMRRTRGRPIPSGRLEPAEARAFAAGLAVLGVVWMALFTNVAATLLVVATTAIYIGVYTPMKRFSTFSTLVGAVPGALPVLAGWAAAGPALDIAAWSLFWILFFWQIPHVLALSWMYREDYRAGGFLLLSGIDPDGERTARQTLVYALALLAVSMLPTMLGLTGAIYFTGAVLTGGVLLGLAGAMMLDCSELRARRVFLASIVHLPALLLLMAVDKVPV